jgi:hypothetical protein
LKGEITIVLKQVVENLVAAETLELSATKTWRIRAEITGFCLLERYCQCQWVYSTAV